MVYDPNYKMRYKQRKLYAYPKYRRPLQMVGDPKWFKFSAGKAGWDKRCSVVYAAMMNEKRGIVQKARVGLWVWSV